MSRPVGSDWGYLGRHTGPRRSRVSDSDRYAEAVLEREPKLREARVSLDVMRELKDTPRAQRLYMALCALGARRKWVRVKRVDLGIEAVIHDQSSLSKGIRQLIAKGFLRRIQADHVGGLTAYRLIEPDAGGELHIWPEHKAAG